MKKAPSAQRRIYKRPYCFELFILANFAILFVLLWPITDVVLTALPGSFVLFVPTFIVAFVVGLIVRSIIAAVRRQWVFFRIIRSGGWLTDTVRMFLFLGIQVHVFAYVKLMVPILHPRLFDEELWDLDRLLFFGMSPSVFALALFEKPSFLRFIDWSYAAIFFWSVMLAFAFFLSHPSRRVRMAYATSNAWLWLLGAWMYLAVPSLGPAYRFPDVWMPYVEWLRTTQTYQALLMRNFQKVLRIPLGVVEKLHPMYGIGAFPSLHVGFQTFMFLHMRRMWIYGQIVFGVFLLIIFLGSLITGWHYLIDGIAGVVLALVAYWFAVRFQKLGHWLRLRNALRRA